MQPYLESFLPLFVAMNLPGVLPLFISLTEGLGPGARRRLVGQAIAKVASLFLAAIAVAMIRA
jgi:multiple antibiotic resistance protein